MFIKLILVFTWIFGVIEDAYDGNKAMQTLNNLIKKSAVQHYINICGFSLDLEKI